MVSHARALLGRGMLEATLPAAAVAIMELLKGLRTGFLELETLMLGP
jgi:hypothetical protein